MDKSVNWALETLDRKLLDRKYLQRKFYVSMKPF